MEFDDLILLEQKDGKVYFDDQLLLDKSFEKSKINLDEKENDDNKDDDDDNNDGGEGSIQVVEPKKPKEL